MCAIFATFSLIATVGSHKYEAKLAFIKSQFGGLVYLSMFTTYEKDAMFTHAKTSKLLRTAFAFMETLTLDKEGGFGGGDGRRGEGDGRRGEDDGRRGEHADDLKYELKDEEFWPEAEADVEALDAITEEKSTRNYSGLHMPPLSSRQMSQMADEIGIGRGIAVVGGRVEKLGEGLHAIEKGVENAMENVVEEIEHDLEVRKLQSTDIHRFNKHSQIQRI
jgi:hypothetical protein